jgi:hypothetical protein
MNLSTRSLVIFLFLGLSAVGMAQVPSDVLQAANCLATKKFLNLKAYPDTIHLGYSRDSVSYPGKSVVYVIMYSRQDGSRGEIFTVFHNLDVQEQTFDIQNNASFVRSATGVDFPNPPLGGTWTQSHIVAAIRRAEKASPLPLSRKELLAPSAAHCSSYLDPR